MSDSDATVASHIVTSSKIPLATVLAMAFDQKEWNSHRRTRYLAKFTQLHPSLNNRGKSYGNCMFHGIEILPTDSCFQIAPGCWIFVRPTTDQTIQLPV
jgi:hypothetical protein